MYFYSYKSNTIFHFCLPKSDGGNSGKAAALILRADKGGRRRSSSMDHKAYDNVSYSVYDNIGTAVDHDMADEGQNYYNSMYSSAEELPKLEMQYLQGLANHSRAFT